MANKMTQLQQLRALAVRVQSSISAVAQAASDAVTAVDKKVDGKAPSSHTHTKSQISDFPTSLPASDVSAWAKASSKPSYAWSEIQNKPSTFAPSSHTHAKADVGLGSVDNTADSAKNVASAGKVRNGGDQTALTGTNSPTSGLTVNQVYNNGYPSAYGNVISVHGIGSGQILAGWSGTSGAVERLYYRNKRDTTDANWSDWKALAFTDDKPATAGTADTANSVDWSKIQNKPSSYTPASHTHNYAGSSSAGGSAASAVKLDSNAGSATQPVYFSGGKPAACSYTLGKSVPSNAVFTDTNTWRGIQNNLTSNSTTDSLSAAQGKVLKGLVDGKAASSHTHSAATSSAAGMMSAADKAKLDGIAAGANNYTLTGSAITSALGYTPASAATAAQMPYSITYEGMYTGTGASIVDTPLAIKLSKVYDAVSFIRVHPNFVKTSNALQYMLLHALASQYETNYTKVFHTSFVPFRALSSSYDTNPDTSVGYMTLDDRASSLVCPRREGSTLYINSTFNGTKTAMNESGYRYFYFGLDLNSSIKGVVK